MSESLKHTRLYPWHAQNGARFGEFAGWDMPMQYERGPLSEHRLVRTSAGLFDVSHMGRFVVSGPDAAVFLDRLLTAPVASLEEDQSSYALMCRDDGGVLDDVFVYRLSGNGQIDPGSWLVVVNASNLASDLSWMEEQARGFDVHVEDRSNHMSMIAFQGPEAIRIIDSLSGGAAGAIPRFGAAMIDVGPVRCLSGRTGYTGEDGVELYPDSEHVLAVWEGIIQAGKNLGVEVGAIGLAARDSLRFEPGFALYGHELTTDVTPLDAGLKWACDFEKPFIGRDAILRRKETATRKMVTVELTERGVPRQDCKIYATAVSDSVIGTVVSGMYAPTVDGYYANAYVDLDHSSRGTELAVDIRGRRKAAVVVKRPIYRPSYR